MSGPPPTIASFRDQIALRYKWYGWLAGLGVIVFIFAAVWWDHIAFISSLFHASALLCIIYLNYIYTHRQRIMDALEKDLHQTSGHFKLYMDGHHQRWENLALARLIIGTVLVAIFFALVIFTDNRPEPQLAAAYFIAFLVGVMLKNWMQFCEQILLHDYHRLIRD